MSALDHLNTEQYEAATAINGVIRVIAGPGTGKTATKTARIAHMLNEGVDPESVVALTFTNKAADEMRERIINQSGKPGYYVFAGTYHKFFIQKILNPHKNHDYFKTLGYNDGFFILDASDADRLMQQTLKNLAPGHGLIKDAFEINKKNVLSWMGEYRSHGLMPHELLKHLAKDDDLKSAYHLFEARANDMAKDDYTPEEAHRELSNMVRENPQVIDVFKAKAVWRSYAKECVKMEGIDFDDVLVHAKRLLSYDSDIARRLCNQYQYFSLDEYQDTNNVQHDVIHTIATASERPPNIFTVGDARQAIYGFRNADVKLIAGMHEQYEGLRDIALRVNYRSSSPLLEATNALAKEMNGQVTDGQLSPPEAKQGNKPTIAYFSSDQEEATWVVDQIQAQLERGEDVSETAVLYRSRSVRTCIEEELITRDLSYEIIGDVSFWERKEVRDTMTLLRMFTRPTDELAMYRFIDNSTLPLTALTARKKAERDGLRPIVQLEDMAYPKSGRPTLKSKQVEPFMRRYFAIKESVGKVDINTLTTDQLNKILLGPMLKEGQSYESLIKGNEKLVESMHNHIKRVQIDGFAQIIEGLYDDFIWPKQKESDVKALEKKDASTDDMMERLEGRRASVKQVLKVFTDQLNRGSTLNEAMDELTLRAEAEPEKQQATVKLMTNHASKGLEFKKVYAIGTEAQSYWRPDELNSDIIDEEGRNFYVAITRAEQDLAITSVAERFINGETKVLDPLPFLMHVEPYANVIDERDDYQKLVSTTQTHSPESIAEQFASRSMA